MKGQIILMDFPVTRQILKELDGPLNAMAAFLLRPERVPLPDGGFYWSYPLKSAEVVQVAKAVRMVSGLRAAWRLAEEGFVTECYTILRTVADFALEIMFIAEGIMNGNFNTNQQAFINQFFEPLPTNPDEFAAKEREYFVSRKYMIAARIRLLHKGSGADEIARITAFLNKTYDSYVHGAYVTAMELFDGNSCTFLLGGHESMRARSVAKRAVASKLFEAIVALELMARTRNERDLVTQITNAREMLWKSDEGSPPTD